MKRIQAIERGDKDCPICYYRLSLKDVVLLDCTHLFHLQCLDSFEKYDVLKPIYDSNQQENGFNPETGSPLKGYGHSCPMCRHPKYKKVQI